METKYYVVDSPKKKKKGKKEKIYVEEEKVHEATAYESSDH